MVGRRDSPGHVFLRHHGVSATDGRCRRRVRTAWRAGLAQWCFVYLAILGPLEIRRAGQVLPVTGVRVRLLLGRLALDADRPVSPDRLADAVWPDELPVDVTNALQALVSRARRALGGTGTIRMVPGGYQLDSDGDDRADFLRLSRAGHGLLAGDPAAAVEQLEAALALWRGELLDGAEFAELAAVALREPRLVAQEDLAEAQLMSAAPPVARLEELSAAHPLRERPVLLLMRALRADGREAAALAAYAGLRERLLDELGTEPGLELRNLHQELLLGTATPPPNPVRRRLTSFVGRDDELTRLAGLLADRRLITLIGPGGAGKTRLARETADLAAATGAEVLFVELASLTNQAELPAAVLAVSGARESRVLRTPMEPVLKDRQDGIDRLIGVLDDRRVLLVLDNCEHLIDGCAALAEMLLEHCPALRIVTTSREALALPGETVYPVSSLPAASALELFADRARMAAPDLVLDPPAQEIAAEICRRLDGLPLAIELAAARLRTMPLAEIAARLDDRFRLLTGGSRTALPRHRTLFAVVQWSWALLGDSERALLEELSVFSGGFDLAAVEAVHGVPDAFDLLLSLAEKSLIAVDDSAPGRYRMLETIREFGRDRLADAGELSRVRRRHADHYARVAFEIEPSLTGPDQIRALDRLKLERDNIFGALSHYAEIGEASAAMTLAISMSWSALLLGSRTTSAAWMQTALDSAGEMTAVERAAGRAFLTVNEMMIGNLRADFAELATSYEVLRTVDLDQLHPLVLMLMVTARLFMVQAVPGAGEVAGVIGVAGPDGEVLADDPEMARLLEFGMADDRPWLRATMLVIQANLFENAGRIDEALAATREAIERFEKIGDRWGLGGAHEALGRLLIFTGELDEAVAAMTTAQRLMAELGAVEDAANSLLWMALIQVRTGDFDGARQSLASLRDSWVGRGSPEGDAMIAYIGGEVLRVEMLSGRAAADSLDEAVRLNRLALEATGWPAEEIAPQLATLALVQRGLIALARNDIPGGRDALAGAAEAAGQMSDMPIAAGLGVAVAVLAQAEGRVAQAAELLGASEAVRGAPDRSSPDVIALRARIVADIGETGLAAGLAQGLSLGRPAALALLIEHVAAEAAPGQARRR